MRRAFLTGLIVLLGCSGGRFTIDVDVLSFLTDSGARPDPGITYDVPASPSPITVRGLTVVDDVSIRLVGAVDEVTRAKSGTLSYRIEADHLTGTADATVRIALASTQQALRNAPEVEEAIVLALVPDTLVAIDGRVELDEDEVDVFENDEVWVRIVLDLAIPASDESLTGDLRVRLLSVRVLADEDLF